MMDKARRIQYPPYRIKRKIKVPLKTRITQIKEYSSVLVQYWYIILIPSMLLSGYLFFTTQERVFTSSYVMSADFRVISPKGKIVRSNVVELASFQLNGVNDRDDRDDSDGRAVKLTNNQQKRPRPFPFPGQAANRRIKKQNEYNNSSSNINRLGSKQYNTIDESEIGLFNILKSDGFIEKVLFDTISIKGEHDFIANHLLDMMRYHRTNDNDPAIEINTQKIKSNLKFVHSDIHKFNYAEQSNYERLSYRLLNMMGLENLQVDPISGNQRLVVRSNDINLTFYLFEKALEKINAAVNLDKENDLEYSFLLNKIDSLQKLEEQLTFRMAKWFDKSTQVYSATAKLPLRKVKGELENVANDLAELKAIFKSRYGKGKENNHVEILERSYFPSEMNFDGSQSRSYLIYSFLLMGFISGFLIFRKFISDILN